MHAPENMNLNFIQTMISIFMAVPFQIHYMSMDYFWQTENVI